METAMFGKKTERMIILFITLPLLSCTYCNENLNNGNPYDIKLPPGFKIEVYTENVPNARSMTLSPEGVLFVGTRESRVYAVVDTNKDYKADNVITIDSGL